MKRNIKHILALFLVIVMSFQMAAFVAADEAVVTEETEEQAYVIQNLREFQILDALGVFSIYKEEDFTGYSELSRAEAAAVAARMVGLFNGYSLEGKQMPYTDVDPADVYSFEIYSVTNLGIMSGYAGEFDPNGSITEEQFIKVVVEALGYRAEAQSMGGYPHGYTIVAGKYHILDDVDYKGAVPITQDVAVQIVYNCLTVEMPNAITVEGGYITPVSKTILSQYLDVVRDYGVLKRNERTYMGVGGPSKDGVVQIGSEFYYTGTSNCEEYLGHKVEFFYKKTAEDTLGTILYAAPWGNEVTTLDASDIAGFAGREYTYYEGKAEKKVKVPTSAHIIYNGAVVKSSFSDYVPTIGSVELIDNDEDGVIDVVVITSYDVYFMESNNTTESVLVAEDGKKIKYLDIYWNVKDATGAALPATKVGENTLLLLAVSKDAKNVTGFQVTEQIEGTFDSYYMSGNVKHVIINDVDYKAHPYCQSLINNSVKLTNYVGFYVYKDFLLVKCLPASSLIESVGYLIDVGGTIGLESKFVVRMLMQTGGVQVAYVADKAKLVCYGQADRKIEDFASSADFKLALQYTMKNYSVTDDQTASANPTGPDTVVVHQPVVYKLNEAGEIVYLEIAPGHNYNQREPIPTGANGMQLVEMVRHPFARFNPKIRNIFNDMVLLDAKSYVIDLPTDLENYDGYSIYAIDEIKVEDMDRNTLMNPWRLYRTGDDILGANIMVGTGILTGTANGTTFILDKISEGITDDGIECYILSGKNTALANVSLKTADKSVVDSFSLKISEGDVITCNKNSYGLVDTITMVYDNENANLANSGGGYTLSGNLYVGGQVYAKKGNIIGVYNGNIASTSPSTVDYNLRYLDASLYKVVIFDSTLTRSSSHIINASVGDIKAYLNDPTNVSSIIATRSNGDYGILVIYK